MGGGKTPDPPEAQPPQLLLSSLLLLLGELPRAPTKTSGGGVWHRAPAPSDRAAVSLPRSKTRDGASALCSRAAAGRLQAGSLPLSPRSTFPAEPAPLPPLSTPWPCRRGARAGPLLQRSGSAPAWPLEPWALRLLCPCHPWRPRPAGIPAAGGRACLGGYRKAGGESGKTGGGDLGKTQE